MEFKDISNYVELLNNAEKNGYLKKGDIIMEAMREKGDWALVLAAKLKGYKLILVSFGQLRDKEIEIIKEYGADIIFSNPSKGFSEAMRKVLEISRKNNYYVPRVPIKRIILC